MDHILLKLSLMVALGMASAALSIRIYYELLKKKQAAWGNWKFMIFLFFNFLGSELLSGATMRILHTELGYDLAGLIVRIIIWAIVLISSEKFAERLFAKRYHKNSEKVY